MLRSFLQSASAHFARSRPHERPNPALLPLFGANFGENRPCSQPFSANVLKFIVYPKTTHKVDQFYRRYFVFSWKRRISYIYLLLITINLLLNILWLHCKIINFLIQWYWMIKMRKKISWLIDRLVPISESNKGQASKIFERLQTDRSLVIIKNNAPVGQCHLDKAVQV